ncbi:MAG: cytochrome c [Planctomycetota bacterium]
MLGPWTLRLIAFVALAGMAAGAVQPVRRARPPAATWDKATAGAFFEDAFASLQGPRPAFDAAARPAVVAGTAGGVGGGAEPAAGGDGFTWSTLVSGDTLIDEIKDMQERVTPAVSTPSTFKGGGYNEAQQAFSVIALAFGLIAAHDEDVRWKKDSATARDLFARAGVNCKVGTDQSFKESQLRVEDLKAMMDGNSPEAKPERDEDFRWSQVSGRPPLMKRLEAADKLLGAAIASQGDFIKQIDVVLHEAEMVAAIGEVIRQPDYEYHDDDSYLGYAASMRDAAARIREACLKKDYESARTAVGEISKSCNDCHGDYR